MTFTNAKHQQQYDTILRRCEYEYHQLKKVQNVAILVFNENIENPPFYEAQKKLKPYGLYIEKHHVPKRIVLSW